MSFECFDDSILVDGPVENEMILFSCNKNGIVIVSMSELLYLVIFHEEFSIALSIGSEVHIECVSIRYIKNLSIIREIKSCDIWGMLFDDFSRF